MQTIAGDCTPSLVLTTTATLAQLTPSSGLPLEISHLPWICVDELLATSGDTFDGRLPREDEVAFLQYTSGSTRAARGVVVCHDNLSTNLALCARVFRISA